MNAPTDGGDARSDMPSGSPPSGSADAESPYADGSPRRRRRKRGRRGKGQSARGEHASRGKNASSDDGASRTVDHADANGADARVKGTAPHAKQTENPAADQADKQPRKRKRRRGGRASAAARARAKNAAQTESETASDASASSAVATSSSSSPVEAAPAASATANPSPSPAKTRRKSRRSSRRGRGARNNASAKSGMGNAPDDGTTTEEAASGKTATPQPTAERQVNAARRGVIAGERRTNPTDRRANTANRNARPAERAGDPTERKANTAQCEATPAERSATPTERKANPAEHNANPGASNAHTAARTANPVDEQARAEALAARRARAERETSAGGIVYRVQNGQALFLLIRDSYHNWGFPKGHLEAGELPDEAAVREVQEETGLAELQLDGAIETIDWFFRFRGKLVHKVCHFYLMRTENTRTKPQREEGITACRWARFEDATRLISYANARAVLTRANDMVVAAREQGDGQGDEQGDGQGEEKAGGHVAKHARE